MLTVICEYLELDLERGITWESNTKEGRFRNDYSQRYFFKVSFL